MNSTLSRAAIVATGFAIAGLVLWQFYAYLASTLSSIPGASHVMQLAYESLAIGIVSLIIAILFWILALRE